jgi:hypothetical protein
VKPEDFAGRMSVSAEEGRLMRLELPENVYRRLMRSDRADICVFDSSGTPVPFEIQETPRVSQTPPPLEVPFFPWTAGENSLPRHANIEIDSDGAVIKVYPEKISVPVKTSSYLVDLCGLPNTPLELVLEIQETGKPWNSSIALQYSENLSEWKRSGGQQTLAFLGETSPRANRNTVSLPSTNAPYILLTATETTPPLLKVWARFPALTKPETIRTTVFPGTKSEDGFSVSYTAEGYFPGTALDFVLPGPDSIDVEILCRSSAEDSWSFWGDGTIFRIGEGGDMRKNKAWTGEASYPYWKISSQGGVPFAAAPDMLLVWEPLSLVFLARGKGPWILAYGSIRFAPPGNLPRQFQEQQTRPAVITGSEIWQPPVPQIPDQEPAWKRWILWGALILAVGVLSAMAYYMTKLMRKQE